MQDETGSKNAATSGNNESRAGAYFDNDIHGRIVHDAGTLKSIVRQMSR